MLKAVLRGRGSSARFVSLVICWNRTGSGSNSRLSTTGMFLPAVPVPTWCTFDPPYKNAKLSAYKPLDDYPGLVRTLLRADYKWVLSEYWDEVYRPLGEPIRI